MKKIFILTLAAMMVLSCAKKEEDEEDDDKENTVPQTGLACNHYVDNGTHAYYQCIDYSKVENMTAEAVEQSCNELVTPIITDSCDVNLTDESNVEYPSTGKCDWVSDGHDVTTRWYYVVDGDGLSETALCTALSGTWTAD